MCFFEPNTIENYILFLTLISYKIFNEARNRAPVLLFFDEFESIAPSRNSNDVSFHYKSEVNEILKQLDKIAESGILFIAATNYYRNIDKAVLRPGRIDKKIFIGPHDFEARIESFKIQLKGRPIQNLRWDIIAELSEYFTHADIEHICNEATRMAINTGKQITTDFLSKIIYAYQPPLNDEKILEYF